MSKVIKKYTYYLFGKTIMLNGVGRIFDLNNSLNKYNRSKTETEADMKAIYLDWLSVGQDLRVSMDKYERIREAG